jgi:hypothetical protein
MVIFSGHHKFPKLPQIVQTSTMLTAPRGAMPTAMTRLHILSSCAANARS